MKNQFEVLSHVFHLKRKLDWRGTKVVVTDYLMGYSRKEGDKTYSYPETIEVKFEGWSNSFFSFRLRDQVWIREGCNLNTTANFLTTPQLYKILLLEIKAFEEHKRKHAEAQTLRVVKGGAQ